jgi:cytochrome bd-type quinol oxidase subunit 2
MRLAWYRLTHWLRHSPLVLVLGLMLLGVALGLIGTSSKWPSTASREEILSALGFIFGGALVLFSLSLTRVLGQVAFASGLYSPRVAARLLARPLVIWSIGLFTAVLTCAGSAWLVLLDDDAEQLSVLPVALSAVLLAVSFLGFLGLTVDITRTFRVSSVVRDTARTGLRAVDHLYRLTVDEVDARRSRPAPPAGTPDQVVRAPEGTFGVLLGFFAPWLVRRDDRDRARGGRLRRDGDAALPRLRAEADSRAAAPRRYQAGS